jgi:hypothetical protein
MDRLLVFFAGTGLGALAGKWLNRDARRAASPRRRQEFPEEAALKVVDVVVRTQSLLREIRALVAHADVPDPVLSEKIKGRIARTVARPDSIQARVEQGKVYLAGTAREGEIRALVEGISAMRGVKELENRMESLTPPFTSWKDAEPGPRPARGILGSYPRSASLIMAAAGLGLAMAGSARRGREGTLMLAGGAALLGAGGAGLAGLGRARTRPVSHMSESSSWRPGIRVYRSAMAS